MHLYMDSWEGGGGTDLQLEPGRVRVPKFIIISFGPPSYHYHFPAQMLVLVLT